MQTDSQTLQRDTLHKLDIKTRKTSYALYAHIKNNVDQDIDWEKK